VFVLKRSMASGFSGADNPLFFGENTRMLFGDAKQSIAALVAAFKS
jgi:H+-translocating NAD(P) transhydrogenase subunit beta